MSQPDPRLPAGGVGRADVLVLIATQGVLLRPWCLLELNEAMLRGLPVVILEVADGGFDLEGAALLIDNLEDELARRSPGAVEELRLVVCSR